MNMNLKYLFWRTFQKPLLSRKIRREIAKIDAITIKKSRSYLSPPVFHTKVTSELSMDSQNILLLTKEVNYSKIFVHSINGKIISHDFGDKCFVHARFLYKESCKATHVVASFYDDRRNDNKKYYNTSIHEIDGTPLHIFEEYNSKIKVTSSPDGRMFLTFTDSLKRGIHIYEGKKLGTEKYYVVQINDYVRYVSFNKDNSVILVKAYSGRIQLHHIINGGHAVVADDVGISKFSNNSRMLLLTFDRSVCIFHLDFTFCHKSIFLFREFTMDGRYDLVWSVSFSPDDQFIAVGCRSGAIYLWSLVTGELIHKLEPIDNPVCNNVSSLCFSPNGKLLVTCHQYSGSCSGPYGGKPMVWSVLNGRLLALLETNNEDVHDVQFLPNGRKIISTKGYCCSLWELDHIIDMQYFL
jgi:WD40 repeat protein